MILPLFPLLTLYRPLGLEGVTLAETLLSKNFLAIIATPAVPGTPTAVAMRVVFTVLANYDSGGLTKTHFSCSSI